MQIPKRHGTEIILTIIALLASLASTFYFMRQGVIVAAGDAVAHLNIARRVVDSINPGFSQLGYVWLPINHLLMLPFIWINSLYYSGLAGSISSMLAFVAAAVYIYKIATLLSGKKLAGIVAFVLFVANPNILYMQSTPLTELFYIFSLTAGMYYLILWAKQRRLKHLILSAVFLLLSNLSRYDGWFISAACLAAVVVYELWQNRNWKRTEALAIIFGAVAFAGPALWFAWNYVIFGNPLYFAVGPYSAKAQQMGLLAAGQLPAYHHLLNSLVTIFYDGKNTDALSVIVIGLAGCCYLLWTALRDKQYYKLLFFLFGLQIIYYIINIYFGNGVIYVPQLWPFKFFNDRYATTFIPFFVIAAAVLMERLKWLAAVVGIAIFLEYGAFVRHGNIITLQEATVGYASKASNASRAAAGMWLRQNYSGGLILSDVFNDDSAAFYSRIPFRDWLNGGNGQLFSDALKNPAEYVNWVFVRNGDLMSQTFTPAELAGDGFGAVYRQDDVTIYKKGAPNQIPAARPPVAAPTTVVNIPPPAAAYPIRHFVVPGDTLWSLAQTYYGNGSLWPRILQANHMHSQFNLYLENILIIPAPQP
jgi:hypothetical protein